MKILVCDPSHYDVRYSINPWMSTDNGIDYNLAIKQWKNLVNLLDHVGAEVIQMSGQQSLPDIVFTANAGFFNKNRILLSNFRFPERQPEREVYKTWFEDYGLECKILPDNVFFEGAGDALSRPSSDEIFFSHGFRSDEAANEHLNLFVKEYNSSLGSPIIELKLVDPYFYHLDTCFCPLPKNDFALIYPEAFEPGTTERLKNINMSLLPVPQEEARRFACNAVSIENCVIIPSGCPTTKDLLQSVGYDVFDTDMSEYIKAGGACKCLTFKLDSNN